MKKNIINVKIYLDKKQIIFVYTNIYCFFFLTYVSKMSKLKLLSW